MHKPFGFFCELISIHITVDHWMLELLGRGVLGRGKQKLLLEAVKLVWNVICLFALPTNRWQGDSDVWIASVMMLSRNVTYFCEYGRYFLIGYYVSE